MRGKGRADADIVLTNYPIEGPVFSGPHEQPYVCATQQFNLPGGAGNLGAPLDAELLDRPTRVDYFYKSTANTGNALTQWPAGRDRVSRRTWSHDHHHGTTVPYIVRMETGTINRAIYQIDDAARPARRSRRRAGTNQPANWNKRLIYTFGGGCIGGWYRQGASTGGVTDDFMLSQRLRARLVVAQRLRQQLQRPDRVRDDDDGEGALHRGLRPAGAHAGLGLLGRLVRAAPDRATTIPGLLDGIIPGCSFPEVGFATINFITDAWLLDDYFNARQAAMRLDRRAEAPRHRLPACTTRRPTSTIGARRIDPRPGTTSCAAVPVAQRYDPATNPTGARCTVYDHTVNVYGRDPATGFARRPLDNVGIQYGLKALNAGTHQRSSSSST